MLMRGGVICTLNCLCHCLCHCLIVCSAWHEKYMKHYGTCTMVLGIGNPPPPLVQTAAYLNSMMCRLRMLFSLLCCLPCCTADRTLQLGHTTPSRPLLVCSCSLLQGVLFLRVGTHCAIMDGSLFTPGPAVTYMHCTRFPKALQGASGPQVGGVRPGMMAVFASGCQWLSMYGTAQNNTFYTYT